MAHNQAFDSRALPDMVLPYAPNAGPLINKPYLRAGSNTYVTWGGTLKKRPGMLNPFGSHLQTAIGYPERLWVYETLEANPVVYLVASVKGYASPTTYALLYSQLSPTPSNWNAVTERRGCNHSAFPHEGVVRRGKLYIRSFANSTDDTSKLGAIYLDGTGGTMATHDWGALPPQTAVALANPGSWTASNHAVTVNNSWGYVYTYQKVSGQETDQSPLQTNPDALPSFTGPFQNLIPKMTVVGLADTTEYPFINIYRTTDGGGTFYFLHQIANSGAGSITFEDKYLASTCGNCDPIPDANLDTRHQAPSTTSNSPPPTVPLPLVTGTDAVRRTSQVVEYAARIWYAIDEYLFYSANEELDEGIPEESFPNGEATPNFFRLNNAITQLIPTPDGLLIMTKRDTTLLRGTSRATFNPVPLLGSIGGAPNMRRAATTASDKQAWLAQDFRIVIMAGQTFSVLSNPLGNPIKTLVDAGAEVELKFWSQSDKEYLVVACHNLANTALTQWFVYDFIRARRVQDDFWFTPWIIKSTALATGQSSASDTENKLFIALWDGTNSAVPILDATGVSAQDINPTTLAGAAFSWTTTLSPLMVPPGDHVNQLRVPDFSPNMASFQYERTLYTSDSDPTVVAYLDDLFTSPISLGTPGVPPRRAQSKGFKTNIQFSINTVAKYAAFQFTGASDTIQAEVHNATWSWLPESGA